MTRSNLLSQISEDFIELVEDLGAKVNKYSNINEYMNIFCIIGQDHSLNFNQCLS